MDRDTAIRLLRDHEAALRARGIARLELFGSTARGEAGADSDVDLLADLDAGHGLGLIGYVRLKSDLGSLLGRPADLVIREGLHPDLRDRILADTVPVF